MLFNLLSGVIGAVLATVATIGYSSYKDRKLNLESQIKALVLIRNELNALWGRLESSYLPAINAHSQGKILSPLYASRDYFVAFENYSHDLGLSTNFKVIESIFTVYVHMKGFLDTCSEHRHMFKLHEEITNLISKIGGSPTDLMSKQDIYFQGLLDYSCVVISEYKMITIYYQDTIKEIDNELKSLRKSPFLFL